MTEVLQGFRRNKEFKEAKTVLLSFPCFEIGGIDIAVQSAVNYRHLRQKGFTIRKTIDTMIAAFCIVNDYILLHNDKDFSRMKNILISKSSLNSPNIKPFSSDDFFCAFYVFSNI